MNDMVILKNGELFLTPEAERKVADVLKQKKALDEKEKEFKKNLKEAMEANGVKKIKMAGVSISYVAETNGKDFDATRFKKENPDLVKLYQKDTHKSAYVTVSLSKEEAKANA